MHSPGWKYPSEESPARFPPSPLKLGDWPGLVEGLVLARILDPVTAQQVVGIITSALP